MAQNSFSKETKEFQAEVKQLLDIVINSLYTDKKVFLRELISNAADALEKLRFLSLGNTEILNSELPLEINIETNKDKHTLTISDTGIGMTPEEIKENLGTIAHSGSKTFLKQLMDNDNKDLNIIGQFGVGFYSAFMVAEKVVLSTRSYKSDAVGCTWTSDGLGSYTIEPANNLSRGTRIELHLKEGLYEYEEPDNIKQIIKQYSSFVPFPIKLNGEKVNTIQAIWVKNKNEITEEEYNEFYKYISNAYDDPLFKLHFSIDAPLNLNALLYVPKENFERFGLARLEPGVNLYCRKVLIQEKSEHILPEWLRFIRGVVDSEELPLNISRETMQDSLLISKLRNVLTGRIIKFFIEQAKNNKEQYKEFWEKFGMFIKEGIVADFSRSKDLAKLLRFETSKTKPGELISFNDYLDKMGEKQDNIYYLSGPNRSTIEEGPYIEIFKENDIEVIYNFDATDDYVFNYLGEFEGKTLKSGDQADIDLPELKGIDGEELSDEEFDKLAQWLKEVLGNKVSQVVKSRRLVDSPSLLVNQAGITHGMQKLMQKLNKDIPQISQAVLEINTKHQIIKKLNELKETDADFAKIIAEQIYDNGLISAGLLSNYKDMVDRIYKIMDKALDR